MKPSTGPLPDDFFEEPLPDPTEEELDARMERRQAWEEEMQWREEQRQGGWGV